jgi:hypothetical protein
MENNNEKWYFKSWSLIVSFLVIGPFMLPLVWANPRFDKKTKLILTLAIVVLTYLLFAVFFKSLKSIVKYYQMMQL